MMYRNGLVKVDILAQMSGTTAAGESRRSLLPARTRMAHTAYGVHTPMKLTVMAITMRVTRSSFLAMADLSEAS